jgi:hypothetical protein
MEKNQILETSSEGTLSLHDSAEQGQVKIVNHLIAKNVAVNLWDSEGNSALQLAAREGQVEVVKLLIVAGARVNFWDGHNSTPLHFAARGGNVEVVRLLLEHGAQVNVSNTSGNMPLHSAAVKGHLEVIQLLLGCPLFSIKTFHLQFPVRPFWSAYDLLIRGESILHTVKKCDRNRWNHHRTVSIKINF